MKNKDLPNALLFLLGMLPSRVQNNQMTMQIYHNGETITVNDLVKRVMGLLDEAIKGKEEEE